MFKIMFFIAIASFSFAARAQDSYVAGDFSALRQTDQAEVVEVIDPLTVLLSDGQIIRLTGIYIPEEISDQTGIWAVTARDVVRDLLAGQRVAVYQTPKKDWGRSNRMGHQLAHLQRMSDHAWAQGVLVSLGLAIAQPSKRNPEMAEQLYTLEDAARTEKLGIWSDTAMHVLTPDETDNRIGDFAIVEGRVESVTLKQNRIYINFGKDWRSDFTVTIAPEDKRDFSKAGIDPLSWGGKTVRVRGFLQRYNGPMIEVTHPAFFEFVEN
ncbi:MAG: thermonuclease family protein [Bdellovibrionales bacterium]